MTVYTRVRANLTASDQSDYNNAKEHDAEHELTTPDQQMVEWKQSIPTGGYTLTLSTLATSIEYLIIENTDDTNYLTATFNSEGACDVRVPLGGFVIIPYVDPATALVLTANTAAVVAHISIVSTA